MIKRQASAQPDSLLLEAAQEPKLYETVYGWLPGAEAFGTLADAEEELQSSLEILPELTDDPEASADISAHIEDLRSYISDLIA